ncbi:MAG: ABC transporter permease subunit, partial [Bacillota bacterium]|nr:ABC transporter permease subunit [Bacillota bacterium]
LAMELRRSYKGVLIWTLAISASLVMVIAIYPLVIDMYAAIPPEFYDLMAAFGGIPDTIVEYYATEGAMMLQLFGSLFAALQGFGAINRDEREKTAESLYSLPLSRMTFYCTKLLRVTLEVVFLCGVTALFSYIGFLIIDEPIDYPPFILFSVLNTLVFLVFAWLCFAMAALLKPNQKPMAAIAIPFVLYVVYTIAMMTQNEVLDLLKYITPFTFADPVEILKTDFQLEWISMTVFLGLTVFGTVAGWKAFARREFTI